ncbi:hypothetical protein ACH4VM_03235 [Streptomyces sp. NPDC020792]|uniref:hypothetical protein n=1 Tax=Streptomyces sp. NPDC020792 TaxID=3365089 RepID=UPI0037B1CC25
MTTDAGPEDVTMMLLGVFLSAAAPDEPEKIDRLLGLIVDALRPALGPEDRRRQPSAHPRRVTTGRGPVRVRPVGK